MLKSLANSLGTNATEISHDFEGCVRFENVKARRKKMTHESAPRTFPHVDDANANAKYNENPQSPHLGYRP